MTVTDEQDFLSLSTDIIILLKTRNNSFPFKFHDMIDAKSPHASLAFTLSDLGIHDLHPP